MNSPMIRDERRTALVSRARIFANFACFTLGWAVALVNIPAFLMFILLATVSYHFHRKSRRA